MRRRSDTLKLNDKSLSGTAARSQNYRSAIASADSFDRYYYTSLFTIIHGSRNKKNSNNNNRKKERKKPHYCTND